MSTAFILESSIAPPSSEPPVAVNGPAAADQAAKRRAGRFWEIDALRGVAILTMIVYHTMWDLWYWGVFPNVVLWQGFWFYWQRFTCGTFLTLVGVSLTISYRRMRARAKPEERIFPHFFWRANSGMDLPYCPATLNTCSRRPWSSANLRAYPSDASE